MRQIRTDIGGRHDRERGADAKLHVHRVRHAEETEHLVENRHRYHAAADAEQAGQDAGHHPARHNTGGKQQQFIERHTEHAATLTAKRAGPPNQRPAPCFFRTPCD